MNFKKKLVLLQSSIVILFIILLVFSQEEVKTKDNNQHLIENSLNLPEREDNIKTSNFWDTDDVPFIHIDNNWSQTEIYYDWCNGKGTSEDPYIIENITTGSVPLNFGILINNSKNDYFIVRNCTIVNSVQMGIRLENTNNGT
jgi:hypothetical protein